MLGYSNIIRRCMKKVCMNNTRHINMRSIMKLFSIYFLERTDDPKTLSHEIYQVGDPALRKKAAPVDIKQIETKEFQNALDQLHCLMKKYDTVGLAAPQIGYSWQVFAIEVTKKHVNDIHPYIRDVYNIEEHPLTYFINPKIEIIDPKEMICYEMCGSINYCKAEVPRPTEIEIKALNRFGEPFSWNAKGWLARIAQHENDHLDGILYVDRMFPLTFEYSTKEDLLKPEGKVATD